MTRSHSIRPLGLSIVGLSAVPARALCASTARHLSDELPPRVAVRSIEVFHIRDSIALTLGMSVPRLIAPDGDATEYARFDGLSVFSEDLYRVLTSTEISSGPRAGGLEVRWAIALNHAGGRAAIGLTPWYIPTIVSVLGKDGDFAVSEDLARFVIRAFPYFR